jgi:hypothetical protein
MATFLKINFWDNGGTLGAALWATGELWATGNLGAGGTLGASESGRPGSSAPNAMPTKVTREATRPHFGRLAPP